MIQQKNLVDLLVHRGESQGQLKGFTFLLDGDTEEAVMTYAELLARAKAIGAELQKLGAQGEPCMLVYPPGLDYIAGFFGTLFGGAIAVPAYPPDPARLKRTLPRLEAIVADCGVKRVLTTGVIATMAQMLFEQAPQLKNLTWVATDMVDAGMAEQWKNPAITAENVAFLQYTSGSTGSPRGVVLSHENLFHNSGLIRDAFGHSENSQGVIWLPPYHDMGLIGGILQPLFMGFPVTLMSPISFLQKPLRWLRAVTRYRATTSGGPNFAYDLCVRKVTEAELADLDLKSWDLAFNGAEPIRHQTLDRFVQTFGRCGFRREAFYPCYGLAEATLIVTGGSKGASPTVRSFQGPALQRNLVAPPRSLVELDVTYWGPRAPISAKTKDISTSGTFIITNDPLDVGSVVKLRFDSEELAEPIQLKGEVARKVGDGEEEKGMGIRFIFNSPQQKGHLERLIEKVTFSKPGSGGKVAQVLVSSGKCLASQEIAIVHPDTMTKCWQNQVGEIWVRGASVANGYWNRPDETMGTFGARLVDTGVGNYLRTGDMGFIREGELFVAGRVKDLIIIRGTNHHPQDIEQTVEKVAPQFLRPGCGAAFALELDGEERLVVVQEVDRRTQADRRDQSQAAKDAQDKKERRQLIDRRLDHPETQAFSSPAPNGTELNFEDLASVIRQAVSEEHELQVHSVVLIKAGSMPKTSSGKVQRHACRMGFISKTLDVVFEWRAPIVPMATPEKELAKTISPAVRPQSIAPAAIEDWLAGLLSARLGLPLEQVDVRAPISSFGVDSLLAVDLENEVEGNLKVVVPFVNFLKDISLSELAHKISEQLANGITVNGISAQSDGPMQASFPLSMFQQSMVQLEKAKAGATTASLVVVTKVRSPLNIQALRASFKVLMQRHPVLQVKLVEHGGEYRQHMHTDTEPDFEHLDVSGQSEETTAQLIETIRQKPFDLQRGPMVRVRVLSHSEKLHTLFLAIHHMVADIWSMAVLLDELRVVYSLEIEGRPADLVPPRQTFWDFMSAQKQTLQTKGEEEWAYWQEVLGKSLPQVELPTDFIRPRVFTFRAQAYGFTLSEDISGGLKELAEQHGTTLYNVLLSAFSVLISAYSGQQDLVLATPMACRSRAVYARAVGPFAQPVVLRANLSGNPSFHRFLLKMRDVVLGALANQDFPFPELVRRLNVPWDPSRHPVFQILFNFLDIPPNLDSVRGLLACAAGKNGIKLNLGNIAMESWGLHQQVMDQFDLSLLVAEVEGKLEGAFHFNVDLFKPETIAEMEKQFETLLVTIIKHSDVLVGTLTEAIPQRLLPLTIASTFVAEPLAEPLTFWMDQLGIRSRVIFAPYNQVFQQLLDQKSLLAENNGGINIILIRVEDWLTVSRERQIGEAIGEQELLSFQRNVKDFSSAVQALSRNSMVPLLVVICPKSDRFQAIASLRIAIENAEKTILERLQELPGVYGVDSLVLNDIFGAFTWNDARADEMGHIPYGTDFFVGLATLLARRIRSVRATPYKVVVTDCDNTLWGGVVAEDGPEHVHIEGAYVELQQQLKKASDAGMLICLSSKNQEEDVINIFKSRPEMVLRLDDIVAHRINWEPKSKNLHWLAEHLNLGLDTFLFLDDNPVECAEVRAACPEVCVLEIPKKDSDVSQFIKHIWAFDQTLITQEDRQRKQMYKQNIQRESFRKEAPTLSAFLAGLNLEVLIQPLDKGHIGRVAQLTQRTNQFNLTTRRYTEADILRMVEKEGFSCWTVTVKDRFGDYGLVGVVLFSVNHLLVVDSFLLSCRVLGRRVEYSVLRQLFHMARETRCHHVQLTYLPTARNAPAKRFLESLGNQWLKTQGEELIAELPPETADTVLEQKGPTESLATLAEGVSSENTEVKEALTQGHLAVQNSAILARIAIELRTIPAIIEAMKVRKGNVKTAKRTGRKGPRNDIERTLIEIWEEILRIKDIGVEDDFLELGGDSVLATQMAARIEQKLGAHLPLTVMFEARTVADLANLVQLGVPTAQTRVDIATEEFEI